MRFRGEDSRRRFIPARAGNTFSGVYHASCLPVHPRSRGEHRVSAVQPRAKAGSSPLARGTLGDDPDLGLHDRFIPARAGNTPTPRSAPPRRTVHPRSRGEHGGGSRGGRQVIGSSPLARGTRQRLELRQQHLRFIPARAGNTPRCCAARPPGPVHPRSRGEHRSPFSRSLRSNGSSPLARGTPVAPDHAAHHARFIPARAGNTHPGSRTGTP